MLANGWGNACVGDHGILSTPDVNRHPVGKVAEFLREH